MKHKGFLVERYVDYSSYGGFKGWIDHKFTNSVRGAKASITQACKSPWRDKKDFRIIELVSNEEEIKI